jgi:hypothetical protein
LREFKVERDHVYLLVNYPAKVHLSELADSLKGISRRLRNQKFPEVSTFWSVRKSRIVLWALGYLVGSVGAHCGHSKTIHQTPWSQLMPRARLHLLRELRGIGGKDANGIDGLQSVLVLCRIALLNQSRGRSIQPSCEQ